MTAFRQNPVSAAIWPWPMLRSSPPNDSRRRKRIKAVIQAAVMLALAFVMGVRWGHRLPGIVLLFLAIFVLVSAFALSRLYDAFERLVGKAAQGVGIALTWILLVPFFYLVFVPGRLILTLMGKDPLHLKFPSSEPTYWVPWKPPPTKDHYVKQYR